MPRRTLRCRVRLGSCRWRGGTPLALFSGSAYERTEPDCLILDHIHGKVFWDIEGNDGVGGHADAAGNWMFVIRMAIVVVGGETTGTNPANFLFGPTAIDPGATYPLFMQGSNAPDGFRCLWRRSWQTVVNFATGFGRDGIVSSEQAASPGGYVDIKPHRIMRPTEKIELWYEATAIGLSGASDSARVWFSHDLRTAAHNTQRRR